MLSRVSRRVPLLLATAVLGLSMAPAAHADLLGLWGGGCGDQQVEQPFSQWGDQASYVLVPGGTFEPGDAAWSTSDSAGVLSGNEPWTVHDGGDSNSLSIPAGTSATSPASCVSLDTPTLRFFAHSSDGDRSSSLHVEVIARTLAGLTVTLPIGTVRASGDWQPSSPYLILVNALALLGNNSTLVAFQFTPQGSADWQIDDVYVDPWSKG